MADSTNIVQIEASVTEIRRPFYNVSADVVDGSDRAFYEKVFVPIAEQEAQKRKNRAEGVKKAKATRERNKKRKQDSIIKARSMMSTEQLLEDLRKQLNSK